MITLERIQTLDFSLLFYFPVAICHFVFLLVWMVSTFSFLLFWDAVGFSNFVKHLILFTLHFLPYFTPLLFSRRKLA